MSRRIRPHVQDDPLAQKIACGAIVAEKRENQAQEEVERKTTRSTCVCYLSAMVSP
jgi:hypothetical protein